MKAYNPDVSQDTEEWLALDEATLFSLVLDFVENSDEAMDEERNRGHCAGHMIAESRLANNDEQTVSAYKRLIRQGLDRHDTIHAIAAVYIDETYKTSGKSGASPKFNSYKTRLKKLTAKRWLKGKY